MKTFDAIIIGGGQAGIPLSHALAKRGWKVALIERLYMGGSCINYGCTPSKKMIASARVAHLARRAEDYGVRVGEVQVDLPAIVAMKDALVEQRRESLTGRARQNENITLLCGEARFTGDHRLQVDGSRLPMDGSQEAAGSPRGPANGEELYAEKIFINTGSQPKVLPIDGIEEVPYYTNRNIMDLTEVPEHLLVIGGGYVGLELSQMFRRFGSRVTVIDHNSQIAAREDEDVAQALREALEEEGIRFVLPARAQSVERGERGMIQLKVKKGGGAVETLTGSHLLLAAGQVPNTRALDPEKTGAALDERGFVQVNEYLETNVPGIYALGDVKGGPKFTHVSYDDYLVVYHNLFNDSKRSVKDRIIPYALYTDPELGRVGMTEKQAREAGLVIKVGSYPVGHIARAVERQETSGLMKVVVDAKTDQILGAAVLSPAGGELVQTLMALMIAGAPWTVFHKAMFIHPTLTEGFFGLMDAVR